MNIEAALFIAYGKLMTVTNTNTHSVLKVPGLNDRLLGYMMQEGCDEEASKTAINVYSVALLTEDD